MLSRHLLWIGSPGNETDALRTALQRGFDDLTVAVASSGSEALAILNQDPGQHLLVVMELQAAHMELGGLVTRIKQINPAIEVIVLGEPGLSWSTLNLPRYYRPILLVPPFNEDVLISCVAKLKEMVESEEAHAHLIRGMKKQVNLSRMNVEALLEAFHRNNRAGVIVIRRDGFFLSCNHEAQRLTGYTAGEVTHIQNWAQTVLVDPRDTASFTDMVDRLWEGSSGTTNMRLQIRRQDGKLSTLDVTLVPILNKMAQPRRMLVLLCDPLEDYGINEYRALLQHKDCTLYTYLPDLGFIRISQAALDLINRTFSLNLVPQDVLGRRIRELPLPQDMAGAWEDALKSLAEGCDSPTEALSPLGLPGRRILGHAFWTRVVPTWDEPVAVLAQVVPREDLRSDVYQNASNEVLAEQTLQRIPRPFSLLGAVRDEGGAIQDFLCLNINSAARGLLGIDASVPVGVTLTEVLADDEVRRDIIQRAGEVTDTGRDVHFETWLTSATNGGEPIRLDIWMGKIGDGAAVFFEDVTASREEERHLKQYRHCFAHMREAIVVTDLKGNIIDWNPSSESMFGYEKSEILGKHSVILTRSAETDLRRRSGANILSNEEVWTGEVEFVRSDGGRGIAFARVGLLKDDQGKPYGTVGLWHDLTERKRLEERLTVKTQELHEKNLALNTLLRHSEKERLRACEQVAKDLSRGMTQRVLQIVEVKRDPDLVETHARLLLKHLGIEDEFTGPDSVGPYFELSEKELEVARLVRLGKTTEEIAFVLDKSVDTVRLQRISIRKKLGLRQRHQSLGGYLRKMAPL